MARPKKDNAEYFSHDCDMRNDKKLKAMRKEFKHEGYAFYNMMLEVLTNEDGLKLELTAINIELLAGDFDSVTETLRNMIDYSVKIELFKIDDKNFIYTDGLNKRLKGVFDKRNKAKERFMNQKQNNNEISVTETTQSKVKYSKVNESKVVINNTESPNGDSPETDQKTNLSKKEKAKIKLTNEQVELKKSFSALVEELSGKDKFEVWNSLKVFIETNRPMFLEPYIEAWNIFGINYGLIDGKLYCTPKREDKIKIRVQEKNFDFYRILDLVKKSEFLKGNNGGWKVTIDFILDSEQNYIQILEGQYK